MITEATCLAKSTCKMHPDPRDVKNEGEHVLGIGEMKSLYLRADYFNLTFLAFRFESRLLTHFLY